MRINNQLDFSFCISQQRHSKGMIIWASIYRTIRSYNIEHRLIITRIHNINWNASIIHPSCYNHINPPLLFFAINHTFNRKLNPWCCSRSELIINVTNLSLTKIGSWWKTTRTTSISPT